MILDKGFCTIYKPSNTASPGNMPVMGLTEKYVSWYGELNFETSPRTVGAQEGVAVSNKIRIIQNRAVTNHDVAVLSMVLPPDADDAKYVVTRAYHGVDSDNGQPITDLSLERVVRDD